MLSDIALGCLYPPLALLERAGRAAAEPQWLDRLRGADYDDDDDDDEDDDNHGAPPDHNTRRRARTWSPSARLAASPPLHRAWAVRAEKVPDTTRLGNNRLFVIVPVSDIDGQSLSLERLHATSLGARRSIRSRAARPSWRALLG